MAERCKDTFQDKKLKKPTDREYNTAVYFLRCKQMGLTESELVYMEYGEVTDMMVESANDHEKYDYLATQEDMNNAFRG